MLMDLDYFFAQCEENRNPSIKNKPVVVCVYSGRSKDSGAVSTANYIARKYGVSSGISIYLAKKKLEKTDAVFLPVDLIYYKKISGKTMEILRFYADLFEQVGIDEAYLDVSKKVKGDFEEGKKLAQKIKSKIKTKLGLSCSIGIGSNKLVAKIAADTNKPDGLTLIKPEQIKSFLFPLPVRRLIGVGKKTEIKMNTLRIRTLGELSKYDPQKLMEIFGKKLGNYYHKASQGSNDVPVQEKNKMESLSKISTLKEDTNDLNTILKKAEKLCEEVYVRIIPKRVFFRSVTITAISKDMRTHSRSKTFEKPVDNLDLLKRTVKELFEKYLKESDLKLRRIGVKVSKLTRKKEEQKEITRFIQT
jgi:DNA polymerase IV (DinB-like DNA polymerase)